MNRNIKVMTSHNDDPAHDSNAWETPREFVDKYGAFDFDLAASENNSVAIEFFDIEANSLEQDWTKLQGNLWLNPPYGRGLADWVRKAYESSRAKHDFERIVMLIPARTDTSYWHEYIFNNEHAEIEFLRGRIKFMKNGLQDQPAPFGCAVIVWK